HRSVFTPRRCSGATNRCRCGDTVTHPTEGELAVHTIQLSFRGGEIDIMPRPGDPCANTHSMLLRINLPWMDVEHKGMTAAIERGNRTQGHGQGIETKISTPGDRHVHATDSENRWGKFPQASPVQSLFVQVAIGVGHS